MTVQQRKKRLQYVQLLVVLGCTASVPSLAGNWDVDGQHGVVYVRGSLTESPCRLAMTSSYQTVEMNNLDIATLQQNGRGAPVPFQIELEGCLETSSRLENVQTGMTAWSSRQPAVKIRFLAATVPFKPNLAQVTGAKGIGLAFTTPEGAFLPLGVENDPQLLPAGQSKLTYYVTPVRTGMLQPGEYSALIAFEMLYD